MFDPINAPPTEHHTLSTGQSTEFGDSAKVAMEKINAGFKHVYAVLAAAGHDLGAKVPDYFGKFEAYFREAFHTLDEDATSLKARVTELEAELRNVKMMVQGLGFAGARVTDPAHSMALTDPSAMHLTDGAAVGLSWAGLTGSSEPIVTVKTVEGEALPADAVIPADTEIKVTVKEVPES